MSEYNKAEKVCISLLMSLSIFSGVIGLIACVSLVYFAWWIFVPIFVVGALCYLFANVEQYCSEPISDEDKRDYEKLNEPKPKELDECNACFKPIREDTRSTHYRYRHEWCENIT